MGRVLLVAIALYALGPVVSASPELLKKARGLMDRKEYTLALETLGQVLSADPKNAEALKLKDEATRLSGEAEALGKIEQMVAEAQTFFELKQPTKAQKRLKEVLDLRPGHTEAQALLQRIELESDLELLDAEASVVKEGDFVTLDGVDEPPQAVKQVPPVYPSIARRVGIEGEARFLVTIGIDGRVEDARFLRKIEGWGELNEAAEKAVRKYQFTPAKKGGVRVRTIVNLSVVFRLGQDVRAPYVK